MSLEGSTEEGYLEQTGPDFNPDENEEVDSEEEESEEEESEEETEKVRHRSKRSKGVLSAFQEEVEEGSDEEEEEGPYRGKSADHALSAQERLMGERIDRRNRAQLQFEAQSPEEIAKRYLQKNKNKEFREATDEGPVSRGSVTLVDVQANLPSMSDPGIWKVGCSKGEELNLVRSIMLKAEHLVSKGLPRSIKSVFCTDTKGVIYVEALVEPLAKQAIAGLQGIYFSKFERIAISEMTSLFSVNLDKRALRVGQYARITRGPLKGDLARVVEVVGDKVLIQAVPRPDLTRYATLYQDSLDGEMRRSKGETEGEGDSKKRRPKRDTLKAFRPLRQLIDLEDLKKRFKITVDNKRVIDKSLRFNMNYSYFDGDYYYNGFLYKLVNPNTFLRTENVHPQPDETSLFQIQKEQRKNDNELEVENDDSGDEVEGEAIKASGSVVSSGKIRQDLANAASSSGDTRDSEKQFTQSFEKGDLIKIVQGQLIGLVGRVLGVEGTALRIAPKHETFKDEQLIETRFCSKFIQAGDHVEILTGPKAGGTGHVAVIQQKEGLLVATVIADHTNIPHVCNLSFLRITDRVDKGATNLGGYELFDFVVLNANESGVVVMVGMEKLRVLTQSGSVLEVYPQEIVNQSNKLSERESISDANNLPMRVGDEVTVTSTGQTGVIKHIMKGNVWVHCKTQRANSGISVLNGRGCVLKGKSISPFLGGGAGTGGRGMGGGMGGAGRGGRGGRGDRDAMVGKTVQILKGTYKGLTGNVYRCPNADSFEIELLSRMKKVTVPRSFTKLVTEPSTSIMPHHYAQSHPLTPESPFDGPGTPFQIPGTPMVDPFGFSFGTGSSTPYQMGNETPKHFGGTLDEEDEGETFNAWRANELDIHPPAVTENPSFNPSQWFSDMLVCVRGQGQNGMGQVAVVEQQEFGQSAVVCYLELMPGQPSTAISSYTYGSQRHSVPFSEMVPVTPQERSRVRYLGSDPSLYNKEATIQFIAKNDACCKFEDGASPLVRLKNLAVIFSN